jgi:hypothetical protein
VSLHGTFATRVTCGPRRGALQIEVLAEGPHGPEVAANFPLYCGMGPPRAMMIEVERLEGDVTALQVAHANFVYLNEERKLILWSRRKSR